MIAAIRWHGRRQINDSNSRRPGRMLGRVHNAELVRGLFVETLLKAIRRHSVVLKLKRLIIAQVAQQFGPSLDFVPRSAHVGLAPMSDHCVTGLGQPGSEPMVEFGS
jgi:hypothetical protein